MPRRLLATACGAIVLCSLPAGAGRAQVTTATPESTGQVAGRTGARQGRETQRPVPERAVSLVFANARLDAVIDRIAASAGVTILYTDRVLPVARLISDTLVDVPLGQALARVLKGTGVVVRELKEGQLVLAKPELSEASGIRQDTVNTIAGRVTAGDTGAVLVGVVVEVKGTKLTATTNEHGKYQFYNVPPGRQALVARLVGYRAVERTIIVPDGGFLEVDLALEMLPLRLQELVTTAAGPQRRLEIANAVTVLRADSIVQTQPINDVTDLLTTRVPGLAVLPTTGAPGDPARLRLRGSSSITLSNDPIVIVDGVRIYAEQSAARSASLAWLGGGDPVAAPSPLDRIDPHSIETIEVLNGPSAATLYGADAANGVIVITTKRGRPGPAHWDISLSRGRSDVLGRFPDAYFGFGRELRSGAVVDCSVAMRSPGCVVDSVLAYQVLNDPELTVLGTGHRSEASLTVSGGRSDIMYALTGSYSDEVGLLRLPKYETDRFREAFGRAPEDWMERPHQLTRWSLSSQFGLRPVQTADVALTMSVVGEEQRRASLEQQLSVLRGTYVDKANGLIYLKGVAEPPTPSLVPDFYRKTTNRALGLRTAVNLKWQPFERFTLSSDVGLNADLRRDESLLPRGLRLGSGDSTGFFSTGQGMVTVGTLNARANYDVPLGWGFQFDAAVGFNYTGQSVADLVRRVEDPAGGASSTGESSQTRDDISSYGWYVEPRLGSQRFFLSTGLRLDGGSNYGDGVGFGGFKLPKLGFSWLISDEPFFPLKDSRFLSLLRIRAAYGQAGVQPGVAERRRLYEQERHQLDGQEVEISWLGSVGNTLLRPERSTEVEGGFDADLFDNRLSVILNLYRKTKNDALLQTPVAPSVLGRGRSVLVNVGVVRNTGFEFTLGTNLLRSDLMQWSTHLDVSHNRNIVVSMAQGLEAFGIGGRSCELCDNQRVVTGYPLFSYWERPVLGYADANGDGILQPGEVLVGDSLVYLGVPAPDYTAALHSTVGLFQGALTVSASLDYQDGLTQLNSEGYNYGALAHAKVDPSAPFAEQAVVVATTTPDPGSRSSYGFYQTVSTLRFNSLSVDWRLPRAVVRWVGAQHGSVAIQGMNLGLATDYHGKDPLVNSLATGDGVIDGGALPMPREWRIRLHFVY